MGLPASGSLRLASLPAAMGHDASAAEPSPRGGPPEADASAGEADDADASAAGAPAAGEAEAKAIASGPPRQRPRKPAAAVLAGGGTAAEVVAAAAVCRPPTLLGRSRGRGTPKGGDRADEEGTPTTRVSFDSRRFVSERVDSEVTRRYDFELRELGTGAYGKVYLAKDRMFKDRLVAIKKVKKPELDCEEDSSTAFQREVEIMKVLDHPSICRLFETYDTEQSVFCVMEYCDGGDLFDRFYDCETIAEPVVADIVKQVASALKYAHGRGIAHRDLKLENICFCSRDPQSSHVKVIDWGLGKYFGHNRMQSNVGSMTFAAPEVLDPRPGDEGYTSGCDIWSLGVIAYVTLCGRPPFCGSAREQLRRMRNEEYSMEGDLWNGVSGQARDFIRGILKGDPKDRVSIDDMTRHPWLVGTHSNLNFADVAAVLRNLERFRRTPDFFSLCAACVARQGDHSSLEGIRGIFCALDRNCDGVLDLEEIQLAFRSIYGEASELMQDVEDIFLHLDLDGTGRITYTEFCAAGLGELCYSQKHLLWAAFKSFDIRDDGRISLEELEQVLINADVKHTWSTIACQEVAREVMKEFGGSDGSIHFQEWLALMQECAGRG